MSICVIDNQPEIVQVFVCFGIVTLISEVGQFAGFFIQARTERNSDQLSSIVGRWTSLNSMARTVPCNGDGVG